jgi:hypothetical protein
MWRVIVILAMMAGSAPSTRAQEMLGAEAFDALTRGKTFYYGRAGAPYGAEDYLEGRRVRWSFLDGQCKDGYWYEEAGLICFVYDDDPDPQCWSFVQGTRGLIARFENDPAATELYEVEQSPKPMLCLGPKIGV